MKILVVTWGTFGDIVPYIALSLGLQRVGHVVQFATFGGYKEIVSSYGVNCVPIDCDAKKPKEPGPIHHTFGCIIYHSRQLRLFKESVLSECWRICKGADAIIFGESAHPIYEIVKKLGIPGYAAFAQPHHQTQAFPFPYMPCRFDLGGIYNWLSYTLFDQLSWLFFRQPINEWRQKTLNLSAPLPWSGVVHRMRQQKLPCLYSYSPSVLPKPSDWPDYLHVTGYWFLDRPVDWQPPTDLVEFLAAGLQPIYISNTANRDKLGRKMVLEVLARTKQRIIVQSLGDDDAELPSEVFNIKKWIPYEWLFPQVAAVVHHGGCGTTMNSLRAGVPMIIIPSITDQFFWGSRVAKLGLGPPPILRKQLSAERLSAAIQATTSDKTMQNRAAAMSKQIQTEDGVMRAIEAFHHHLHNN
jgi:sterol 3beta-glucosyltransferase